MGERERQRERRARSIGTAGASDPRPSKAKQREIERERESLTPLSRKTFAGGLLSPGVLTDPHAREREREREREGEGCEELAVVSPNSSLHRSAIAYRGMLNTSNISKCASYPVTVRFLAILVLSHIVKGCTPKPESTNQGPYNQG